jgi:hypothetical protein
MVDEGSLNTGVNADEVSQRIKLLTNLYKTTCYKMSDSPPADLMSAIHSNLLELAGFKEHSDYLNMNHYRWSDSDVEKKWIPYCIKKLDETGISLSRAIREGKIFSRIPFKFSGIDFGEQLPTDLQICKKIEEGAISPSFEVFFWCLNHSGVRHFGNDFGFFERVGSPHLQITLPKQDGKYNVSFKRDYSRKVSKNGDKYVSQVLPGSKPSRVNSLGALWIALGDKIVSDKYYNDSRVEFSYCK